MSTLIFSNDPIKRAQQMQIEQNRADALRSTSHQYQAPKRTGYQSPVAPNFMQMQNMMSSLFQMLQGMSTMYSGYQSFLGAQQPSPNQIPQSHYQQAPSYPKAPDPVNPYRAPAPYQPAYNQPAKPYVAPAPKPPVKKGGYA